MRTWAWIGFGVVVVVVVIGVLARRGVFRSAPGCESVATNNPAPAAPVTSEGKATGSLAFLRAGHLRRGINLSNWYTLKGFSTTGMNAYMSVGDMQTLKRLGFDHVRLSIDPEQLTADAKTGELWPYAMARLDKTVADLTAAGLNVVLDIQPLESWKTPLASSDAAVENLFAFWTAFATHYAKADPEKVFFEVLNEPTMADPYRWEGIQARVVARIRSVAPQHTVIATAARYDAIEGLVAMEPLRDANVIYTFHDYEPMEFTQQGATWGSGGWATLRNVPYPSTPENMRTAVQHTPDDFGRLQLERFAAERWDASRIALEVAAVDAWEKRRGVPVYCGEFGVYKDYADPQSRVRWISDTRSALEAKNIGWAMWDYDGNFGLMTTGRGKVVADQDVLHALGLGK